MVGENHTFTDMDDVPMPALKIMFEGGEALILISLNGGKLQERQAPGGGRGYGNWLRQAGADIVGGAT